MLRDIGAVVSWADGNADERQRSNLKDPIHIAIAGYSIRPLVRRIIQFYRDERRKSPVTNHKVVVLGFNVIEIRFPKQVAFIRFDQVGQSDFREHGMRSDDAPENVIETFF